MWKWSTNKTSERKQAVQQNKGLWVYLVNRNKGCSLKSRLALSLHNSYKRKWSHMQANNTSLLKLPKIQYKRKKINEKTTQSKPSNHRQKLVCMEKLSGTEVSWEQNVISQFWSMIITQISMSNCSKTKLIKDFMKIVIKDSST